MSNENPITTSSYMLRDLVEIKTPESISWMPQTVGWQVLAILTLLLTGWFISYKIKQWYRNRYRREAIEAMNHLNSSQLSVQKTTQQSIGINQDAETELNKAEASLDFNYQLSRIIKITANYAYPNSGVNQLMGEPLLIFLDSKMNKKTNQLNSEEGQLWQQRLLSPSAPSLTEEQQRQLIKALIYWLQHHKSELS
ncbi:DUF4381 domain-containing protein [Vibrio sp. SS-MA-C1-2]|uniref:DUF4381 domain-containing protein n=1 Tax=Vibrio sp. SS-MA-C1-2 TaxID=2908646 RepID=UPI001F428E6B|nr:DUF4381 domain-containing protein [Vibrio sp. SS-MA-C1-2]UJF18356.1 DUF4381 domain-containing protein [Vibrio sp. SS-MA-C1-2]